MIRSYQAVRWGDNDRRWWRFTYSPPGNYNPWAVVLKSSGDSEDWQTCTLRISAFSRTLIITLPDLIKPERKKIIPGWDWQTIERLGRDWYWDITTREFGFSYSDGFLQVFFGRVTHDSSTEQNWCKHLPWTQWRHVRHSFYDLTGAHVYDESQDPIGKLGTEEWHDRWNARQAREDAVPTMKFAFRDFDGEALTATTKIEEREWLFGVGWFKWLSLFRRSKIHRSLDIRFSGETGKRKGSWKGGTIGHSIEMLPDELHESAFRRYCSEHEMTFMGEN